MNSIVIDQNKTLKEIVAGSVGGILQVLCGQPFDCIKVRLQTQPTPPIYLNALDCLNKTIKNDGLLGLYKGTLTPLIGISACVSIQFSTLEQIKRTFNQPLNSFQLFLAGGVSGITNSILSGPIEHIRTRLQIQSRHTTTTTAKIYTGPIHCIATIYKKYGIAGIYKAQAVTVAREFFGYGVYFLTYESLIQRACQQLNTNRNKLSLSSVMVSGALAGYVLWTCIFPIDLIKSKLQTDSFNVQARMYRSAFDCAKQVIQRKGILGLYQGFGPCILRAAPVNAVTFIGYEFAMKSMT